MAHFIAPLATFLGVTVLSGSLVAAGTQYTLQTVAGAIGTPAVAQSNFRQGYVASLPQAKPADLDIARSVPVRPVGVRVPAGSTVEPAPIAVATSGGWTEITVVDGSTGTSSSVTVLGAPD